MWLKKKTAVFFKKMAVREKKMAVFSYFFAGG